MHTDKYFMNQAYKEAIKALNIDEVPVGAVIVKDNKIIARAHNLKETLNLSTAHAEILAINKASKKLKTWHLDDCIMYVTLEPCVMCVGAILNARIENVYFGAYISNGSISASELSQKAELNHKTSFEGGYFESECSKLVSSYFKAKRKAN